MDAFLQFLNSIYGSLVSTGQTVTDHVDTNAAVSAIVAFLVGWHFVPRPEWAKNLVDFFGRILIRIAGKEPPVA